MEPRRKREMMGGEKRKAGEEEWWLDVVAGVTWPEIAGRHRSLDRDYFGKKKERKMEKGLEPT